MIYAVRVGRRWRVIDCVDGSYSTPLRAGHVAVSQATAPGLRCLLRERAREWPTLRALREDYPEAVRASLVERTYGPGIQVAADQCRGLRARWSDEGKWCVDDMRGGTWWPGAAARAEIEASADPGATAVRICEADPMSGAWHQ